jgi:hypothetical protein
MRKKYLWQYKEIVEMAIDVSLFIVFFKVDRMKSKRVSLIKRYTHETIGNRFVSISSFTLKIQFKRIMKTIRYFISKIGIGVSAPIPS